jgi:hypothetical protein
MLAVLDHDALLIDGNFLAFYILAALVANGASKRGS